MDVWTCVARGGKGAHMAHMHLLLREGSYRRRDGEIARPNRDERQEAEAVLYGRLIVA